MPEEKDARADLSKSAMRCRERRSTSPPGRDGAPPQRRACRGQCPATTGSNSRTRWAISPLIVATLSSVSSADSGQSAVEVEPSGPPPGTSVAPISHCEFSTCKPHVTTGARVKRINISRMARCDDRVELRYRSGPKRLKGGLSSVAGAFCGCLVSGVLSHLMFASPWDNRIVVSDGFRALRFPSAEIGTRL